MPPPKLHPFSWVEIQGDGPANWATKQLYPRVTKNGLKDYLNCGNFKSDWTYRFSPTHHGWGREKRANLVQQKMKKFLFLCISLLYYELKYVAQLHKITNLLYLVILWNAVIIYWRKIDAPSVIIMTRQLWLGALLPTLICFTQRAAVSFGNVVSKERHWTGGSVKLTLLRLNVLGRLCWGGRIFLYTSRFFQLAYKSNWHETDQLVENKHLIM